MAIDTTGHAKTPIMGLANDDGVVTGRPRRASVDCPSDRECLASSSGSLDSCLGFEGGDEDQEFEDEPPWTLAWTWSPPTSGWRTPKL